MIFLLCPALLMSTFLTGGAADSQTKPAPPTRRGLRVLIASAHSKEDYERLAAYYREQAILNERLSAEQERIWKEELQHPRRGSKYPTAAESARHLHDYYSEQSRTDRDKAKSYELQAKKGA